MFHASSVLLVRLITSAWCVTCSDEADREDVRKLEELRREESRKVADLMRLRRKLEDVTRLGMGLAYR
jgi:hypothetical protein